MKNTVTVFFLIAMFISNTQTFRHVYVKWIKDNSSVLDQFEDNINKKIEKSKSLEELVILYKKSNEDVKAYESDKNNVKIRSFEMSSVEPYKTRKLIKSEIISRENDQKNLNKLKFYWFLGLFSAATGVAVFFSFDKWLGFSGILVGFGEMLCWTSPLFYNRVMSSQFERLLNCKLTLSIITWILIILLWTSFGRKKL